MIDSSGHRLEIAALAGSGSRPAADRRRPSVVFVLADDMGYGDASCLNPAGKIRTPHLDSFAAEGMIFTDAHATSALCSPSRYGILTGRYNWRSTLQAGIVGLFGRPLIAPGRLTVPGLLRQHGYRTSCIGKWHLGQGWDFAADADDFFPKAPPGAELQATDAQRAIWHDAFSRPTIGGPTACGFDYYFGVDVPNWPPYCYIENDRTVGVPSEFLPGRLVSERLASIHGPAMPYWHFEQLLPAWAKAVDRCVAQRAAAGEPFFLYLPLTSPHTPHAVNHAFLGKSGLNLYGDFMIETDDVFGRVLDSLQRHGVADNTLVIFASDNGYAPFDLAQLAAVGHDPSAGRRGYKADIWDGGHRIPCIARWPGVIGAGTACNQIVCLGDLLATCAEILGVQLPDNAGEDSVSLLPFFRDPGSSVPRLVVHHSGSGKFAIRDRQWKLVLCPGSGGWGKQDAQVASQGLPMVQLYNLEEDPGERNNLWATNRARISQMLAKLKQLVADGRSTPGAPQSNDAPIDRWKLHTMPGVSQAVLNDY